MDNIKHTVLITGGSRGLGLAFVKQYLSRGWHVIATARQPSDSSELNKLLADNGHQSRLLVIELDITDDQSIAQLAAKLQTRGVESLEVLINNAGKAYTDSSFDEFNTEKALLAFRTNALGPVLVFRSLVPFLEKNCSQVGAASASSPFPKVVNISSDASIISMSQTTPSLPSSSYVALKGYGASKAALNMFTKCLSLEFPRINFILLHPGHVLTDMNSRGSISPDESATQCIAVIEKEQTAGKQIHLFSYTGEILPF